MWAGASCHIGHVTVYEISFAHLCLMLLIHDRKVVGARDDGKIAHLERQDVRRALLVD